MSGRDGGAARAFYDAYERSGDGSVLDEAVRTLRAQHAGAADPGERLALQIDLALLLCVLADARQDPQPRAEGLGLLELANLGSVCLRHHEVFGDLESLNTAITCLDAVVSATGARDASRPVWLASRGIAYQARYLAEEDPSDLDAALESLREAVAGERGRRSAGSRTAQGNLAEALRLRAGSMARDDPGREAVWDEAVEAMQIALRDSATQDEKALRLTNLGVLLMERFEDGSKSVRLDQVLSTLQEAVDTSRPEDPRHAIYLSNLASAHFTVGLGDDPAAAMARAQELLREAAGTASAPPLHRIWAAYTWARLACRRGDLDAGIAAFSAAIALVPELTGPRLIRSDRQRHLADLSELARDAAACALQRRQPGDLGRAIEFLERGRGVLIAQALLGQQDAGLLRRLRPGLADQLGRLDAELAALESGGPADASPPADGPARRPKLVADRADTIRQIRECGIPELADFLQPPALDALTAAAATATVVLVNMSDYRCDAIIVTPGSLSLVPCGGLSPGLLREHLSRFEATLDAVARLTATEADDPVIDAAWSACSEAFHRAAGWLWNELAEPVLRRLELTEAMQSPWLAPRIWWIPTGELARFPVHAAGLHDQATRENPASVALRVVSCYATSLTALRQAVMVPAPPVPAPGSADTQPALVVAMPSTPSLGPPGDLPAAVAECDLVSGYLPGTVRLVGPEATRSSTMAALRDSAIAHLACHAVSEPDDPSRGRILVHDGALTVAELQALPIWRRNLAFLSACNTADASGGIPDEAIHLASALQVIGFEHVIGTTWQVPDDLALAVTGRFYAAPAGRGDPDDFAAALHASVAAVLADDPLNPFPWTYVLYGAVSGG